MVGEILVGPVNEQRAYQILLALQHQYSLTNSNQFYTYAIYGQYMISLDFEYRNFLSRISLKMFLLVHQQQDSSSYDSSHIYTHALYQNILVKLKYPQKIYSWCFQNFFCIVLLGGEDWAHNTSLTPPLFIKVFVSSQEIEQLCKCVLRVLILSLLTIFLLDFRTVLTVCYLLFSMILELF